MSTSVLEAPKVGKKYKFRLMAGNHCEGRDGNEVTYQVERDPVSKKWIRPIIETDNDLAKKFNSPGFPPKFELVDGSDTPIVLSNPTERIAGETIQEYLARQADLQKASKGKIEEMLKEVDKLSKEDLEAFAEENEIDLKNAKTIEAMRIAVKNVLKG